jgi:hypothetical protein
MHNRMLPKTRFVRSATALLAVTLLLSLMSGSALAAPPSNDTVAGATAVTLGFSQVLDTTEATTDNDDAQLNAAWCNIPATDASVWYTFTATSDIFQVVVDVSQSNYSAQILVGVGSPGNLQSINCGDRQNVSFSAVAGKTYYVLVFDDYWQGGSGNGGSLSISFYEAVSPTADITVNRFGQVDAKTGFATISGTYTCTCTSGHGDRLFGNLDATQNVGRFTFYGHGEFYTIGTTCDGTPHPWSSLVTPMGGKFAGGKLTTLTSAYVYGICGQAQTQLEQTVQLRVGPK